MNENFVDFMRKYSGHKLAVAVSGGVDSVCLVCWLAAMGLDIVALHVNHGLRAVADDEEQYVQYLCKKLNVPCQTFRWCGEKPANGIEAAARDARYKFMTDWCHENGVNYLVLAHQADDQIETFLMNLGRGSGIYGLAGMQAVSVRDGIQILRPLLDVKRAELVKYCDENGIKYCHDEMNDDVQYTRVKIRKNRHLMDTSLGISDDRILLAVKNLGRIRDALVADVDTLVESVRCRGGGMFSHAFLFDLGDDIRLKFLGTLIKNIGGDSYQPRLKSLHSALDKLSNDCKFTLGHCTVRRLGEKILVVPEGSKTTFRKRNEKKQHKQQSK